MHICWSACLLRIWMLKCYHSSLDNLLHTWHCWIKFFMDIPSKYCFASLIFQLRNIWFNCMFLVVCIVIFWLILLFEIIRTYGDFRNYSDLLWFSKFFLLSIKNYFRKKGNFIGIRNFSDSYHSKFFQLYWSKKFRLCGRKKSALPPSLA